MPGSGINPKQAQQPSVRHLPISVRVPLRRDSARSAEPRPAHGAEVPQRARPSEPAYVPAPALPAQPRPPHKAGRAFNADRGASKHRLLSGCGAQMCQGVLVQRETYRAAALIATLVAVGVVLVAASDSSTPWSTLGQALVSGGVVGGVFVFIESSLARAAERRSQQDNLVRQITLTEKLVGVELDGRVLRDLYLPNKNLTAARLRSADFSRSVLLFGDFRHADATGALLVGADLGGSTLQRATLANASARGCCFLDADLTAAVLTGCDLRGADLSFAVLREVDLRSADLRGAQVMRADLSGADMTEALLDGADLTDVRFDAATRWPDGAVPAQSGPELPPWPAGIDLAGWLVRRADLRGR